MTKDNDDVHVAPDATVAHDPPPAYAEGDEKSKAKGELGGAENALGDDISLSSGQDILDMQDLDPALNMKMHLVNNVSEWLTLATSPIPDRNTHPCAIELRTIGDVW